MFFLSLPLQYLSIQLEESLNNERLEKEKSSAVQTQLQAKLLIEQESRKDLEKEKTTVAKRLKKEQKRIKKVKGEREKLESNREELSKEIERLIERLSSSSQQQNNNSQNNSNSSRNSGDNIKVLPDSHSSIPPAILSVIQSLQKEVDELKLQLEHHCGRSLHTLSLPQLELLERVLFTAIKNISEEKVNVSTSLCR